MHFIAMLGFTIPGQTIRHLMQAQSGQAQSGREDPGSLFRPHRPTDQP